MAKKKADTTETSAGPLVAFKGFDTDFKCRDMQYEGGIKPGVFYTLRDGQPVEVAR